MCTNNTTTSEGIKSRIIQDNVINKILTKNLSALILNYLSISSLIYNCTLIFCFLLFLNNSQFQKIHIQYYQQYALGQTQQNVSRVPGDHNLEGLIGEMEKNQSQIQMQNYEISQLQERVQQFLRQPSGGANASGMEEGIPKLPPIQGSGNLSMGMGMMKSDSQPVLGMGGNNMGMSGFADPSGLSMTLRKDDSNQRSLYKQAGMSTTMSQATMMTSQQLNQHTTVRKDSRSKQL